MDMINVWSHSAATAAFERKPCNPAPGFSNVWQNLRLMQRIAGAMGRRCCRSTLRVQQLRRRPRSGRALPCPALFVLGNQDVMTPRAPRGADRRLPRRDRCAVGRRRSLADAERPDQVLTALKDLPPARSHPRQLQQAEAGTRALLDAVNWDTYWLYVLTEMALSCRRGRRSC